MLKKKITKKKENKSKIPCDNYVPLEMTLERLCMQKD